MLIMSSFEFRPSYDELDLDPYIGSHYNAEETFERYFANANIIAFNVKLVITIQGEQNQREDDELEFESPNEFAKVLKLLKSGDYTIDEGKIVVKNDTYSTIYAMRNM